MLLKSCPSCFLKYISNSLIFLMKILGPDKSQLCWHGASEWFPFSCPCPPLPWHPLSCAGTRGCVLLCELSWRASLAAMVGYFWVISLCLQCSGWALWLMTLQKSWVLQISLFVNVCISVMVVVVEVNAYIAVTVVAETIGAKIKPLQ